MVDVNPRGILDIGQDVSRTLHAVDVLAAIQQRLEQTGAHESLHHFHRMSPCELALIVRLEAGIR